MISIVTKATGIWLVIMFAAVANGAFRDNIIAPEFGAVAALPLSGLLLSLIIFTLSWLSVPLLGRHDTATWLTIGFLWVILTLSFEFSFGYFIAGMSLQGIIQIFDLSSGNLFLKWCMTRPPVAIPLAEMMTAGPSILLSRYESSTDVTR